MTVRIIKFRALTGGTTRNTGGRCRMALTFAAAPCGGYKKTDMSPEGDIAMNKRGHPWK